MKKRIFAVITILCLAEEENQVDVSFESYMEAGSVLYVTWTDDAYETGSLGIGGTPGQTIGEALKNNDVISMEPMLEGDVFEGWMEVAVTVTIDEFGFEENEYSLIPDQCYTTEELMALTVPEHNVTYVAKWAGIPAEEYFTPYEEETIVMPSITLLSGEGNWSVATIEPGQTFGEVLELKAMDVVAPEGKMFAGWTVYEYNVESMETSESHVEEEGVLCFELFEDYHMILREYAACAELLSTEELAEYACAASDHVAVVVWMTAEEYLAFVKERSDAIKSSLEQDALTQADMNQKSEDLRALWDKALNHLLDEAKKILPEAEAEKLMAEQNAWGADTEAAVEAAGKEYEGGSMYPLIVNAEAAKLAEERVCNLYELLK